MAKPWEQYQQTQAPESVPVESTAKPWETFAKQGQAPVTVKNILDDESWISKNAAALGVAPAKLYYGLKQIVQGGTLSPEDQQAVKDWNMIESSAPVGAIGSNLGLMYLGAKGVGAIPGLAGVGSAMMAPTSALKAASVGAGYSAVQPTEQQGAEGMLQRGKEAGKGAFASLIGYGAAQGLSRAMNPQVSQEVKLLQESGITPTPGQIIGGGAKKAEEAMRSVPIVGDVITSAHKKNIEQFNRAAINRALNPVGEKIEKSAPVGYKAVENAYIKISDKYDDLLPKLKIEADDIFKSDLDNLTQLAGNMNPAQATQFNNIVKNEISDKFTSSGLMSGETMKNVESKLGQLSRNYLKDADYDKQQLGSALREAQSILRGMVERNNPKYAGELQKINNAYSNLLIVENAASRQGAKEGIFTPNQLEAATRAMDTSLRKRQFAHGKALMQDLATAGDVALSQKLPTSGTTERALYGGGTLVALGGGLSTGMINPLVPVGIGLGSLAYTQPAQKGFSYLMTQRPEVVRELGVGLKQLAPYAGLVGAGYAAEQ